MPENCTQCTHADGCRTYYGGSLCHYSDEINRAAIAREEEHGRNNL